MRGYPPVMHCVYAHFDLVYDPERSHWDMAIPGGTRELGDLRALMHPPLNDPVIKGWCGRLRLANHAVIGALLERLCFEHLRSRTGSMVS